MMKSKRLYTLGLCLLVFTSGWAQQKSIEKAAILQTALEEFFRAEGPEAKLWQPEQHRAQGTYIPGYGMVLKAPAYQPEPMIINQHASSPDSLNHDLRQKVTDLMTAFLQHYASLASLAPQEKILVYYDNTIRWNDFKYFYIPGPDTKLKKSEAQNNPDFNNITALVSQEDIQQHPNDLKEYIKIEVNQEENDYLPYRVLGKIWHQLLENSYDSFGDVHLKTGSMVSYQLLSGFGIIYSIPLSHPFFASTFQQQQIVKAVQQDIIRSQKGNAPNPDNTKETVEVANIKAEMEKMDQAVDSMYAAFKQSWKQHIVEYGRTLKNLPADQRLMVHFTLPEPGCESCTVPSQVRFVVEKEVLDDYDQGNLSLPQAAEKVQVEEFGKTSRW